MCVCVWNLVCDMQVCYGEIVGDLIKVFKKRGKENGKHKLALLVLVDGCDWLREWAKYLFWNEMIRYWDRRFRKKKWFVSTYSKRRASGKALWAWEGT